MSNQPLLNQIAEEVKTCKKCVLCKRAKNAVPGEGNPNAKIMLIGEAPGKREDLTGRPFVGAAGKLLDSVLEKAGIRREDIFIGNIAKHRPPDNRAPKPDEIEACAPYLDRQIKIIKPEIIVSLGTHSSKYILEKAGLEFTTISEARGKVFDGSALGAGIRIMPSFHPAAVIYNRKLGKTMEKDFGKIRKELRYSALNIVVTHYSYAHRNQEAGKEEKVLPCPFFQERQEGKESKVLSGNEFDKSGAGRKEEACGKNNKRKDKAAGNNPRPAPLYARKRGDCGD